MATTHKISKLDDAQRLVFGYANVSIAKDGQPIVDLHDDMIAPADLETAAYAYNLDFRGAGEAHDRGVVKGVVGTLVESCVLTGEKLDAMFGGLVSADVLSVLKSSVGARWWVGFKVDASTFAKAKSGEFSMFSIQGTAEPVEVA